MSDINVKMLYAGMGDSIMLSFKLSKQKYAHILIDGGNNFNTYRDHLKKEVEQVSDANQLIDLAVITHIDQDHIKGMIYLARDLKNSNWKVNEDKIAKYWFNSPKTDNVKSSLNKLFDISIAEMQELEKFLHSQTDSKWSINERIFSSQIFDINGAQLRILSPTRAVLTQFADDTENLDIGQVSDDYDITLADLIEIEKKRFELNKEDLDTKFENTTSIAFLFEHGGKSILFLGDATPETIDNSIKDILNERKLARLRVDAVKLSHHASRKSTSWTFLELVDCATFLICTNGNKAKLPNKATFAKILGHSQRDINKEVQFKFNYPDFSKRLNFTEEEKNIYNFTCEDSNYEHGYLFPL